MLLAGGRASRLGGINKSLILIEGRTIIDRSLDVLRPLFSEIIVAGWPPDHPLPQGVTSVTDSFNEKGPLGGIEAAMNISSSPYLFVFAGDMPWLSEEIIIWQVNKFRISLPDVFLPNVGGMAEPLHAVMKRDLHCKLVSYLENTDNPGVINFYKQTDMDFLVIPPDGAVRRAFTNINTSEDLSQY